MKKLNVSQMEVLKGGLTRCQAAVAVGCGITGAIAGVLTGGLGSFVAGAGCSMLADHYEACKGKP
ncbi:hypothetical protein [Chryseobacterium fistulae]|jgi:hypothetical protein|uniref:Bacteriocin n=1 Tax=Chryseobacterium fistulae TaxID=2675058 RepID=A0A6N4XWP1_9FLAO|nr:hypothetical protein [Chryseobacterium fistulae]CAA7392723.1 hypothetical protein CHRY9393_03398 [Chryseobacterium fistulae]